MENVKTTGAVFTPSFIVNLILDNIHYDNENILQENPEIIQNKDYIKKITEIKEEIKL